MPDFHSSCGFGFIHERAISRFVSSNMFDLDFIMSKRREFRRVNQKPRYDLPGPISREIGRIVVRWTYLEHCIQAMIWAIAFDADEHGAALGRIAIREPSSKESRLDLLEWVAHVRKVKLNSALLKSIKKRSRTIGNQRNLIAHGLWTELDTELDQGWMVQQTRGAWLEYKGGPRGSKRITPESVPLGIEDLRSLTAEIETVIEDIKALKGSIGEA